MHKTLCNKRYVCTSTLATDGYITSPLSNLSLKSDISCKPDKIRIIANTTAKTPTKNPKKH